tara:strand:+ start:189 stop:1292 length:1104 start_codon:yes stop_codon:yes gene_type:complete
MAFKMKGMAPMEEPIGAGINQKKASEGKVKRQVRRAMRKGYDYDVDMNTGKVTRGARVNTKDVKLDPIGLGSTGKARRQRAKNVASAYANNTSINVPATGKSFQTREVRDGLSNVVRITRSHGSFDDGVRTIMSDPNDGPKMRNSSYINQVSIETSGNYQVTEEDKKKIEASKKRLKAEATAKAEKKADDDVAANPLKNRETRNYEASATNIRQAETPAEIDRYKKAKAAYEAGTNPGFGRFNVTEKGTATRSKQEPVNTLKLDSQGIVPIETKLETTPLKIPTTVKVNEKPSGNISGGAIYRTKDKDKTKTKKDTAFRDVNKDGNQVTRFIDKVGDNIEKGKRKRKVNKQQKNKSRGNCPPCPPCD